MKTAAIVAVIALVCALVVGYVLVTHKSSSKLEKCPKKWDRPNSPVCPAHTRTSTTNSCECEPCEDDQ